VSNDINFECDVPIAGKPAPTGITVNFDFLSSPMKKPAATAGFFSKQEAGA
jgi:hypothetical protein